MCVCFYRFKHRALMTPNHLPASNDLPSCTATCTTSFTSRHAYLYYIHTCVCVGAYNEICMCHCSVDVPVFMYATICMLHSMGSVHTYTRACMGVCMQTKVKVCVWIFVCRFCLRKSDASAYNHRISNVSHFIIHT